eukprot:6810774-Pyramimonas_sp.AAC.1
MAWKASLPQPPDPPKARADKAGQEINRLEQQLLDQRDALEALQSKLDEQRVKVETTRAKLAEADETYSQAIKELHAAVVPAKEPGSEDVLTISLDQLLDGKAVIKFGGVESLFGLADYED